jgi:hypothetical protein
VRRPSISFPLFVKLPRESLQPRRQLRFRFKEFLQVMRQFLHDHEAERHIGSVTRMISPLAVIWHGGASGARPSDRQAATETLRSGVSVV